MPERRQDGKTTADDATFGNELISVRRITRDIRDAARMIDAHQARFLVDAYYQMQDDRIRTAHRLRKLEQDHEPNAVFEWLQDQTMSLERSVQRALAAFSTARVDGRWLRSITGIGPVIAAGLMANIDIARAPTVGHIWRFAGLDPTVTWAAKTKRPWNPSLKRLCWIMGESFTKVAGLESDVYGKVYVARKQLEIANNDAGAFSDQAARSLANKRFGDDTGAKRWYSGEYPAGTSGVIAKLPAAQREAHLQKVRVNPGAGLAMLPPGRIHLRAQRVAVKLFLSAYHHVLYESTFGTPPPKPYILTHADHAHYIPPPNWPMR